MLTASQTLKAGAALQRSSVQHATFDIPCDDLFPPSMSALASASEEM